MRVFSITLLIAAVTLTTTARAAATELRYFDDAALRSVQFVDDVRGWAVGDEGAVWHTDDAGKSWVRQPTGVRASLKSVHFLLPYRGVGWIAGREELPGGGSVGVILFTNDGGASWQRLMPNAMPGLNQVRFLDATTGFLLGDGNEQFASGVFKTTDGGKTWEPVKGPRTTSWFAGDFQDSKTGVLTGAWGKLANFRNDVFSTVPMDVFEGRSILGLQVVDGTVPFILAVGQGGLITGSKAGQKWGIVETKLPRSVLANLDFHAIHSVGPKIWIVGRPGSVVLASDDQGENWTLYRTGQELPLNSVYFFDSKRGWAVGEGGTILGTTDGGQSWTVQHQGGKRAAMLFVHAHPEQLPLETLARHGADEGYLAVALRCVAPDSKSSAWTQALAPQRFAAGTRLAGGMSAESLWQFPLPQYLLRSDKKAVLDYWNQLHASDADRELLRQLVLAVRIWRPSVVVGDAPYPQLSGSPSASLVGEALQAALLLASDPQNFPEQIDQLGLAPWRAARFFAGWERKNSHITYDANQIGSEDRLDASYRDFVAPAARILNSGPWPVISGPWSVASDQKTPEGPLATGRRPLATAHYRLLACAPNETPGQRFLLENVSIAEDARRKLAEQAPDPQRHQASERRRNLVALAERYSDPGKTLPLIGPMLEKLPDDQRAEAAYDLASSYVRQGQWLLARETLLLMVERYPAHPLSTEAYRWLIRHAGSSEARRRHEMGQFLVQTTAAFDVKSIVATRPDDALKQSGQDSVPNDARQWYRGGQEFGRRLAAYGPLYASDPSIQFSLQSARRQLGEFNQAIDYFSKFAQFYPKGPWHDAAVTELWLAGRAPSPAKPLAECKQALQKPFLDGDLDDPCWRGTRLLDLKNAAGDSAKQCPTRAMLTFDDNFLYIAVRCEHPREMYVPAVKNRARGAAIDAFDRVSILLDLDRDYGTCFQLQVDQRGCVREDCWGDTTWNPKWFVAVKSTPDAWQLEAAVPLAELTSDRVLPNSTCWACNVVRILPGRGVQAWSLPADVQPRPEGMGLLMFRGN